MFKIFSRWSCSLLYIFAQRVREPNIYISGSLAGNVEYERFQIVIVFYGFCGFYACG